MWSAAAQAKPVPMVEAHVHGAVERPDADRFTGVGAGVEVGLNIIGPLWGELMADVGWLASNNVRLGFAPQLRVYATPRDKKAALSFVAGVGADVLPTPRVLVHAGGALDVFATRDVAVRMEAGYVTHGLPVGGARFAVGVVWSPAPREEPDDGDNWVPYPVCDWRHPDEVAAYLEALEAQGAAAAEETAADAVPVAVVEAPAEPPPPSGEVVVIGTPGDVMRAGEQEVFAGPDGVAVLRLPPGGVAIEVEGGGRKISEPTGVSEDHVTWMRVPPPKPSYVYFAQWSAEITPSTIENLAGLLANAGAYKWVVHGSHSTDGTAEANAKLAQQRAEAVRETLIALGAPEDDVTIGAPDVPDPDLSAESQRNVRVQPVVGEEAE